MERELAVLMERAGVDMTTVKRVRRYPDRLPYDLWDFSSASECQRMLSTLVVMNEGETLTLTGGELFDALLMYDVVIANANDSAALKDAKFAFRERTKTHALGLITAKVPALDDWKQIDLLRELWPMMDATKAGADIKAVKNVAVHLKQVLQAAKGWPLATIESYDPVTDDSWGA